MNSEAVVSRFAPSPTGRMHAGNIFSYLVNWIETKRRDGRVLLRVEDIDPQRSKQEYVDYIMRDLKMLGLSWDGEVVFQSARQDAYNKAFEQLCACAEVYPCFCTRASVHAASAPHAGEHLVYPGTCYALSSAERVEKERALLAQSKLPSMRIHVAQETVSFIDAFQGLVSAHLQSDCGDFVLKRNDAGFAYNLAVVVDDAAMNVNLVTRGCDLLSVTPQQIFLQRLLNVPQPRYAHVPLLVDQNGRRIAKRDHDASLDELLTRFKSPEGILGHIAYLAGMIETDEACSAQDLLASARLDALQGRKIILWH